MRVAQPDRLTFVLDKIQRKDGKEKGVGKKITENWKSALFQQKNEFSSFFK